ncbi:MAG: non-homologous end-joining DNA ligase [Bacillota bacterium]|nr:non-homologous end-joining DNA ligase [Bacillota bacterium]
MGPTEREAGAATPARERGTGTAGAGSAPAAPAAPLRLAAEGRELRVTHPDRLLWRDPPVTKRAYLAYLARVAPLMLPWLRGRPLVVTRYPGGVEAPGFYQKETPAGRPAWVRTVTLTGRRPVRYVVCDDLPTLLWLGSQAVVEFHPWNAPVEHPHRPDWAVIDLDPQPPLGLREALELALDLRPLLAGLGLPAFPKLSGGRGLHLFLPLEPRYDEREVQRFVRSLGELALRRWPGRVTLERAVARRGARIYVDFLQNGPGRTMVAVFSPRPRPGAPVSFPLAWEEVGRLAAEIPTDSHRYTLLTVPSLLEAGAGRAWTGFWQARSPLPLPPGHGRQEPGGAQRGGGSPSCPT